MNKSYRPLKFYISFAKRLIYKYMVIKNIDFKPDDAFIGYVAYRIMVADSKYDYNKVSQKCRHGRTDEECKKYYLRMYGIYGIRTYLDRIFKNVKNHTILSTDLSHNQKIDMLNIYATDNNTAMTDSLSNQEYDDIRRNIDVLLHSSNLTKKQIEAVQQHIFESKTFQKIASEQNPPVKAQAISDAFQRAVCKMRNNVKNKV